MEPEKEDTIVGKEKNDDGECKTNTPEMERMKDGEDFGDKGVSKDEVNKSDSDMKNDSQSPQNEEMRKIMESSVSTSPCKENQLAGKEFQILIEKKPGLRKISRNIKSSSCISIAEECCHAYGLEYGTENVETKIWNPIFEEFVEFPDTYDISELTHTLRILVIKHNKEEEEEDFQIPICYNSSKKNEEEKEEEEEEEEEEEDEKKLRYYEEDEVEIPEVIQHYHIKVKTIEDELDDDYLVHVRKLPKQSTQVNKKFGEEESEGEEDKEELKPPEEIIEGLKISITKPNDPLIEKKTKLCVCGKTSSGKSSLLNFIMSGDMNYVCPSGELDKTKVVSFHKYTADDVDVERVRTRLQNSNENPEGTESKIILESHKNELWKNVTFVDTPGLDTFYDKSLGMESKRVQKGRVKIEREIKTSDIVLFLVDPRNIDSLDVHEMLSRVTELNNNVIVAITKFDLMVTQICQEQRRNFSLEKNEDGLEEEIIRIFNFLQEKFLNFGVPVVCVQVKKKASVEGPHYFNSQYLVHVIRSHQSPSEGSMLFLKNRMYKFIENRRQIPLLKFQKHKENQRKQRQKILAIGGGASALSASVMLGGIGIIGIAAGSCILIVPGLGTGIGSTAISTGLVALGGSVVGGIALIGGTLAFSGVSAVVGGLVAYSISTTLGKWSLHVPASGRVALSFFHEDVGNVIGNVMIDKKKIWKKIVKYEKISVLKGKNSNDVAIRKKYFNDEMQDYFDSTVVLLDGKHFVVVGRFKNAKLITIINIYCVSIPSKNKKRKKKNK